MGSFTKSGNPRNDRPSIPWQSRPRSTNLEDRRQRLNAFVPKTKTYRSDLNNFDEGLGRYGQAAYGLQLRDYGNHLRADMEKRLKEERAKPMEKYYQFSSSAKPAGAASAIQLPKAKATAVSSKKVTAPNSSGSPTERDEQHRATREDILVRTILGEAGGEGSEGMNAVLQVILNRAESGRWPNDPAIVALDHNKKGTYAFSYWNSPKGIQKDSPEYKKALAIVRAGLAGKLPDPTGGATHYYANKGPNAIPEPDWFVAEGGAAATQLGNHRFASKVAAGANMREGSYYAAGIPAKFEVPPTPATMSPELKAKRAATLEASIKEATSGKPVPPAPLTSDLTKLAVTKAGVQGIKSAMAADYSALPASKEALQRVIAKNTNYVAPNWTKPDLGNGNLVTRTVKTVDINEVTGLPQSIVDRDNLQAALNSARHNDLVATPGPKQAAATTVAPGGLPAGPKTTPVQGLDLPKVRVPNPAITRDIKTTVVNGAGVLKPASSRAGETVMAASRPASLPVINMPGTPRPDSMYAPKSNVRPDAAYNTIMVKKTIQVKNPEWGKINPVAVNKLQDIHDKNDDAAAARMAAATPVVNIPEYLDQTILVPKKIPIIVPPRAPGAARDYESFTPPPPVVQQVSLASGKLANVGQEYTSGGRTFIVNSDGTTTDKKTSIVYDGQQSGTGGGSTSYLNAGGASEGSNKDDSSNNQWGLALSGKESPELKKQLQAQFAATHDANGYEIKVDRENTPPKPPSTPPSFRRRPRTGGPIVPYAG